MNITDHDLRLLQSVESFGRYPIGNMANRGDKHWKRRLNRLSTKYGLLDKDEQHVWLSLKGEAYAEGYNRGAEHWFANFIMLRKCVIDVAHFMRFKFKGSFHFKTQFTPLTTALVELLRLTSFYADKMAQPEREKEEKLLNNIKKTPV